MLDILHNTWTFYAATGAMIFFLVLILMLFLQEQRKYKKIIDDFLIHNVPLPRTEDKQFLRYLDRYLEKKAREGDLTPLYQTGRDKMWIRELMEKPNHKNLTRIVNYLPHDGLFAAFYVALKKDKLMPQILDTVKEEGLLQLASSCHGQIFDGEQSLDIFIEQLDEIRELTGHPSWNIRYFAINILVHHPDDRSLRAVWEAFEDSHPLIRRIALENYKGENKDKFAKILIQKILNDGNQEVRRAAFKQLKKVNPGFSIPELDELTPNQILHYVEFLDIAKPEEVDMAVNLVLGNDWEIRLPAALFLAGNKRLRRMLEKANFEDKTEMQRIGEILKAAAEVQVLDYLMPVPESEGALYLGLTILEQWGSEELCFDYVESVFHTEEIRNQDLWRQAIKTLHNRNFSGANRLLSIELQRRRKNEKAMEHLLASLPANTSQDVVNVLLEFLNDPTFPTPDLLIDAILKTDSHLWLSPVINILKEGRLQHPHPVRMWVFKLLGKAKVEYTLSFLMEQLPTLPLEESMVLAEILNIYNKEAVISKTEEILRQPDGQIRASLLNALPKTLKKHFQKDLQDCLQDPDPEVRGTAISSLIEIGDTKSIHSALNLLRDPIESVRRKAARTIGEFGNGKGLEELQSILADENELLEVKQMGIAGICAHSDPKIMEGIIKLLDQSEELAPLIQEEMSEIRSPKHLGYLVKTFKDADPVLREKIQEIFKRIGPDIEPLLQNLLELDIESLKPYLGEILDSTGFIDQVIRRLKHRDNIIRKEAAGILALIESKASFRGILLAAKDPDEDVRVMVTKALEKLATKECESILEELMNDPDKRVRKYTKWAMERVTVKNSLD